jgi:hypothetical protein
VVRPSASQGTNASGVELRNVRYRGKLVLFEAHAPILNVQYDNDACGPSATGCSRRALSRPTDERRPWDTPLPDARADHPRVRDGLRELPGHRDLPPGAETVLVCELQAGWYRYVSRWRFHDNGTIRPRFGFDAVQDTCVCNVHHHHVYWRFDFDIGGANNEVREFNSPPIFPRTTGTPSSSRRGAADGPS